MGFTEPNFCRSDVNEVFFDFFSSKSLDAGPKKKFYTEGEESSDNYSN